MQVIRCRPMGPFYEVAGQFVTRDSAQHRQREDADRSLGTGKLIAIKTALVESWSRLDQGAPRPPCAQRPGQQTRRSTHDTTTRVVFVVDDDAQSRDAVCTLVRSMGLRAEPLPSADEFLERCRDEPGCVVADLRMHGLSGIELQEELRRRGVAIPVIVVPVTLTRPPWCGPCGTAPSRSSTSRSTTTSCGRPCARPGPRRRARRRQRRDRRRARRDWRI